MEQELQKAPHDAWGGRNPTDPKVRAQFIRQLLDELAERDGDVAAHRYSALAGVLEDAKHAHDELSLLAAQRGLQRLYSRQLSKAGGRAEHYEQRGRTLQALDGITWTLQRLTPAATAASLESGSHAQRFLEAVERNPGMYSGQIAEVLDQAREDVLSRVGSRLERDGLVRKRRVGRKKHWYLTPRGRAALDALQQEERA